MSSIVSAATSVDPILQGLWAELEEDPNSYRGFQGAPPIPVDGLSYQYLKPTRKMGLTLDESDANGVYDRTQPMAIDAPARPIGDEFEVASGDLERFADKAFIANARAAHLQAAHGVDLVSRSVRQLWHLHKSVHDYKVFTDTYSTAGNFGTATDHGNFTTHSTDYLDPALTAVRTIRRACGFRPNFCFMPFDVAIEIAQNDDVRKSTVVNSDDQQIALDQLAAWHRGHLGVDLVIVEAGYENSSGTDGEFMGDHIAFVYLDDRNDGLSFCNTFWNSQVTAGLETDAPALSGLTTKEEKDPQGLFVIADAYFDVKVVNSAAGYQFTDALS